MTVLVLPLPGAEALAARVSAAVGGEPAELEVHRFPDGEVRVRIAGAAVGRRVVLAGSLDRPDGKILPLLFAAATARDLGAVEVGLVAPYLSYLRQDIAFRPGEGVSARHFARLLSAAADWVVTVDPHLHRIPELGRFFTCRTEVVHTAPLLAQWIRTRVRDPLVLGPDEESRQWVEGVARAANAPWALLAKRRRGDRVVEMALPSGLTASARRPVLVDDIVASGTTMSAAVRLLRRAGFAEPLCLVVHPVFAPGALEGLREAGAGEVVSCDTIPHPTNGIEVGGVVADAVAGVLERGAALTSS